MPFGNKVIYKPSSPKVQADMHFVGPKTLHGLFIGYKMSSEAKWDGTVLIVDCEELSLAEGPAPHAVHLRRVDIREITVQQNNSFPLAEGKLKQPISEHQEGQRRIRIQWRGSLDTNDDEERPADNEDDRASPNGGADFQDPEFGQEVEARRDSEILKDETDDRITLNRECITVHILVPRTSMFIPTEENMPLPFEYIDVMRTTRTNIDGIEAEIEDVWYDNANAGRELTEPWVGTTTFYLVRPRPKKGYAWQYGNCNGLRGTTPRPDFVHPEVWPGLPKGEKPHLQRKWKMLRPFSACREDKKGNLPHTQCGH